MEIKIDKDLAHNILELPNIIGTSNADLINYCDEYESTYRNIFSQDILDQLSKFHTNEESYIIFSGLPIDKNLPSTPSKIIEDNRLLKSVSSVVRNILIMHRMLKINPTSFFGENDNNLFYHVSPKPNAILSDVSSHGANKPFLLHVDNPGLLLENYDDTYFPTTPDTLSLFCLRNSESITTDIMLLDTILASLDASTIEILQEPIYDFKGQDYSFDNAGTKDGCDSWTCNIPVLEKIKGQFLCRYDYHRVISKNKRGADAIQSLNEVITNNKFLVRLLLKPGDLLIFKNKRLLHGRGSFETKTDGNQRWLMRMYGSFTKPHIKSLANADDPTLLNTSLMAPNHLFRRG